VALCYRVLYLISNFISYHRLNLEADVVHFNLEHFLAGRRCVFEYPVISVFLDAPRHGYNSFHSPRHCQSCSNL
jgi:hypothetical protein